MEQVNTLHPGNAVNDPKVKKVRSSNKFDEKYAVAQGQRFGQLNAPFFFDAVAKDRVVLRSAHNVRSYTLKSPLLSDLSLKKDYFQVTRRAILPRNWEKFFAQPNLGDDVTVDVGTTVENFGKVIATFIRYFQAHVDDLNAIDWTDPTSVSDEDETVAELNEWLSAFVDIVVRLGGIYSYGGLLAAAGFSLESCFEYSIKLDGVTKTGQYDSFYEIFFDSLADFIDSRSSKYITLYKGSDFYAYVFSTLDPDDSNASVDSPNISLRRAIELIQDDSDFHLVFDLADFSDVESNLFFGTSDFGTVFQAFGLNDTNKISLIDDENPCDLARLFAYQMVCAHYYTNDSIDFVFSADLYRQTVRAAYLAFVNELATGMGYTNPDEFPYFNWNGIQCQYDDCSAKLLNLIPFHLEEPAQYGDLTASIWFAVSRYLSLIFAWRNSLRFTDYFTGAKSRPLAVGDLNIAVQTDGGDTFVSVLDVTKNIQRQRFFNAVNRTGRKIEQYLEGIFGAKPSHDWHNPLWLGHTKDSIIADEVENNTFNPSDPSGNNEQLVSATLRGASNNYAFEVQVDEPSILLGISYFDIPRFYLHATERIMMHKDRFDMFNPFMQFIGDQDIKLRELTDFLMSDSMPATDEQFGFAMRNMEYKQRFSRALGPFATGVLPSWLFTDSIYGRGDTLRISPEYIRSSCVELDKYYTSLIHNSPANYFHFIVINYNECGAVRNMVYAPNIL